MALFAKYLSKYPMALIAAGCCVLCQIPSTPAARSTTAARGSHPKSNHPHPILSLPLLSTLELNWFSRRNQLSACLSPSRTLPRLESWRKTGISARDGAVFGRWDRELGIGFLMDGIEVGSKKEIG